MTCADIKGLAVSTTSADALAAYERGVDLFLRWRGGAMEALELAAQRDPSFALAHCTRAYIAWRMGRVDLAMPAAHQALMRADDTHHERERQHVQAVDAMQRGEQATAYDVLARIAAEYPTDRIAVRIVGLHCITQGHYRGGRIRPISTPTTRWATPIRRGETTATRSRPSSGPPRSSATRMSSGTWPKRRPSWDTSA